jgi:hypothetical protein
MESIQSILRLLACTAFTGASLWHTSLPAATANNTEVSGVQTVGERGIAVTVQTLMNEQATREAQRKSTGNEHGGAANVDKAGDRGNKRTKSAPIGATSVAIGTQFTAITRSEDPNFSTANPSLGVGPTQLIAATNGRIRSFNKSTGLADGVVNFDTTVFFSSVISPGSIALYPQVRFDRLSQRWFVLMQDVNTATLTQNRFLLAVSDSATLSATSSFRFFWFLPTTSTNQFGDAPSLAIDANALYVTAARFRIGMNGSSSYEAIDAYVIRKSSVLGTGAIVATRFADIDTDGFVPPVGLDHASASSLEGNFIGVKTLNGGASGVAVMQRWIVNDPGGSPTLSAPTEFSLNDAISFTVGVPSAGTSALLGANDRGARLQAKRRGNKMWLSYHLAVDVNGEASSSGARNAVRWHELDIATSTPTQRQNGTIFDSAASAPQHFWVPSINVSGQEHVYFGFSTAGVGRYANAAATRRLRTDPIETTRPVTLITNSASTVSFSRWSIKSQTEIDPDDDMTAWTIQVYANATNSWGAHVAQLRAPPPPRFIPTPTTVVGNSTNNILLDATSTANGEEFFDPGAGFAKRLRVAIPGFTVNSVQYVSPTRIIVNATSNAGTTMIDNVVVTNPDDQTSRYSTKDRLLTVVVENGLGRVVDDNAIAGACESVCVTTAPVATGFALRALPTAGAIFVGWTSSRSGACMGANNVCNVSLNENVTVYATFAPGDNYGSQTYNVDASIQYPTCRATVDAAMIVRFLRGVGGTAISGVGIPSDATNNAAAIALQLAYRKPYFDADGNGVIDAATDGVLIARYLAGFRGNALTDGAIGAPPVRTQAQIEAYMLERTSGFPNGCVN